MLKEVLTGLLHGKHDPALFTPAMRTFLSTATGKAFWKWFASHGALGSFTYSDREDAGNTHIFRYKLLLGENAYWFSVATGEGGRIARISFW